MKNIKTFEGFLNFLKKKPIEKLTKKSLEECFYDIIEESRIKFRYSSYWRGSEKSNECVFKLSYYRNKISDNEVKELLEDSLSKLGIYQLKYVLSVELRDGNRNILDINKKFNDVNKLFDSIKPLHYKDDDEFEIYIKITDPRGSDLSIYKSLPGFCSNH